MPDDHFSGAIFGCGLLAMGCFDVHRPPGDQQSIKRETAARRNTPLNFRTRALLNTVSAVFA